MNVAAPALLTEPTRRDVLEALEGLVVSLEQISESLTRNIARESDSQ